MAESKRKGGRKDGPNLFEMMQQQAQRVQTQPGLGTGADSARRERAGRDVDEDTIWVARERIEPNPAQPRKSFPEAELATLGESLRADGQLQALVVRPHPTTPGRYQIVSGERRWQAAAAKYGGVPRLRVTVRTITDEECLRLALVENVQRKDLDTIEVARGLEALRSSTRVDNNEDLGRMVGFTRSRVQQLLALLDLPKSTQKVFDDEGLNEKHGRALLQLDGRAQSALLREIQQEKLSGNEALRRAEAARRPAPTTANTSTPHAEPSVGVPRAPHPAPIQELQRGQGFDQAGAPQPKRYDPLDAHLRPALAQISEAARRVEETPRSPDYWRDVLQAIARMEADLARIREATPKDLRSST